MDINAEATVKSNNLTIHETWVLNYHERILMFWSSLFHSNIFLQIIPKVFLKNITTKFKALKYIKQYTKITENSFKNKQL